MKRLGQGILLGLALGLSGVGCSSESADEATLTNGSHYGRLVSLSVPENQEDACRRLHLDGQLPRHRP